MHALWLLQSLGALEAPEVERALKDPDGRIREQALRLAEPLLGKSKALANAASRHGRRSGPASSVPGFADAR